MGRYRIDCTTKDGPDPDYRLDGFGGANADGTRWYLKLDRLLEWIDAGHSFYVIVDGQEVDVIPKVHANGNRYVTTEADGFPPNNLQHLQDCR